MSYIILIEKNEDNFQGEKMRIFFICFVIFCSTVWVSATSLVVTNFDHNGDGLASGNGADTFVSQQAPDNTGSQDAIKLRSQVPLNHVEMAYLRFDTSNIEQGSITDAKIRLYDFRIDEGAFTGGDTFEVRGLNNESLDNWSETGITWNTAPGITNDGITDAEDFNSDTTFLGSFVFTYENVSVNGFSIAMDLNNLANFLNSDTNGLATLIISHVQDGADSLHHFASREANTITRTNSTPTPLGSLAPQLVLEADIAPIVPEPGSFVFFAFALAFCWCQAQRAKRF